MKRTIRHHRESSGMCLFVAFDIHLYERVEKADCTCCCSSTLDLYEVARDPASIEFTLIQWPNAYYFFSHFYTCVKSLFRRKWKIKDKLSRYRGIASGESPSHQGTRDLYIIHYSTQHRRPFRLGLCSCIVYKPIDPSYESKDGQRLWRFSCEYIGWPGPKFNQLYQTNSEELSAPKLIHVRKRRSTSKIIFTGFSKVFQLFVFRIGCIFYFCQWTFCLKNPRDSSLPNRERMTFASKDTKFFPY